MSERTDPRMGILRALVQSAFAESQVVKGLINQLAQPGADEAATLNAIEKITASLERTNAAIDKLQADLGVVFVAPDLLKASEEKPKKPN